MEPHDSNEYCIVVPRSPHYVEGMVLEVLLDIDTENESKLLLQVPDGCSEFHFSLPNLYLYCYDGRRYEEEWRLFDLELKMIDKKGNTRGSVRLVPMKVSC